MFGKRVLLRIVLILKRLTTAPAADFTRDRITERFLNAKNWNGQLNSIQINSNQLKSTEINLNQLKSVPIFCV